MRILIVEDDDTSRLLISDGLSDEDDIVLAKNGNEALDYINENKPVDLVITDLVMPGMSGLEVLEHVKNTNPCTEVMVVTGHASYNTAVEAMQKGARDYIEKPLNMELLLAKVENVRDYITRLKEIDDYRFAKDILESNASRSLIEMEKILSQNKNVLEKVEAIIVSDKQDKEKVEAVKDILKQTEC